MQLWIAQNDETGEFYITDDSDLNSHGPIKLTDDEYRSYCAAAAEYDDWQMYIGSQIRENRKENTP